jgi:hypothetical protein
MKRLLMLGFAVALMSGIGRCAEPLVENESPFVPLGHWAYEARWAGEEWIRHGMPFSWGF